MQLVLVGGWMVVGRGIARRDEVGRDDRRLAIEKCTHALGPVGSRPGAGREILDRSRHRFAPSPRLRTARNASCGTSTAPTCFIRLLPAFCFSSSLRFRVMSPP